MATDYSWLTIANLLFLSLGKRPLLDEIKFKDDAHKERFQNVKQLVEACWHNDLYYRPTMEMIVSCLLAFQRKASRSIQSESDIQRTSENIKLSKHGSGLILFMLIEFTHIAKSLHIHKSNYFITWKWSKKSILNFSIIRFFNIGRMISLCHLNIDLVTFFLCSLY